MVHEHGATPLSWSQALPISQLGHTWNLWPSVLWSILGAETPSEDHSPNTGMELAAYLHTKCRLYTADHEVVMQYSTEPRLAMQSRICLSRSQKTLGKSWPLSESISGIGGTLLHDFSIGPNPATIGSVQCVGEIGHGNEGEARDTVGNINKTYAHMDTCFPGRFCCTHTFTRLCWQRRYLMDVSAKMHLWDPGIVSRTNLRCERESEGWAPWGGQSRGTWLGSEIRASQASHPLLLHSSVNNWVLLMLSQNLNHRISPREKGASSCWSDRRGPEQYSSSHEGNPLAGAKCSSPMYFSYEQWKGRCLLSMYTSTGLAMHTVREIMWVLQANNHWWLVQYVLIQWITVTHELIGPAARLWNFEPFTVVHMICDKGCGVYQSRRTKVVRKQGRKSKQGKSTVVVGLAHDQVIRGRGQQWSVGRAVGGLEWSVLKMHYMQYNFIYEICPNGGNHMPCCSCIGWQECLGPADLESGDGTLFEVAEYCWQLFKPGK